MRQEEISLVVVEFRHRSAMQDFFINLESHLSVIAEIR